MITPPLSWYISVNRCRVVKDLDNNPDLKLKLGSYYQRFTKWCARERLIYEENIFDEVETFMKKCVNNRLYNIDNKLWKQITHEVFERDNYTCQYCHVIGGILEVDHVIPISRGGTNELSNLVTACRRCNRQKKDKTPEEFEAWKLYKAVNK